MSEAWILFLGTSSGVPAPGKKLPSILLHYNGIYLLLDAGEGAQITLIEQGIGPGRINAVLITHLHGDHVFGLPGLLQSMGMSSREKPLLIKGPREIMDYIYDSFRHTGYTSDYKIIFNDALSKTSLNGFLEVKGFPTCHDNLESYGYKIIGYRKKRSGLQTRFILSYTGDTMPCDKYINAIRGTEILIHDSTFDESKRKEAWLFGHSASIDAAEIALKTGVKTLFLFHQSTRYKNTPLLLEREARMLFENTYEAIDGMKFYF